MENVPQVRIIYDRRKTASRTTKGAVEIEVYYERDRVRFSTGVSVYSNEWKTDHVSGPKDANTLNEKIMSVFDTISKRVDTMVRSKHINLSLLKETKKLEDYKSVSFFDWLEDRIYKRDIRESTRKQHLVMLKALKQYGQIKEFGDLTTPNIKLWDDWLHERVDATSSVHSYHKRLKTYIAEAIQLDMIRSNPYEGMRIPRGKSTAIKYITEEERDRIEKLTLYGPTAKARDMFIFACYTGLAYSDLIKVSKEDIVQRGDQLCIIDRRQKTGQQYVIVLLPKALEILERYRYNINLMSNQKCNDYLKIIAQMADIRLNLTFHMGRHTFATWALTRGVGIETVSKMLAHSDISMTEKYAKVLNDNLIKSYDMLK
jgi:site-specific recombinase XerD